MRQRIVIRPDHDSGFRAHIETKSFIFWRRDWRIGFAWGATREFAERNMRTEMERWNAEQEHLAKPTTTVEL